MNDGVQIRSVAGDLQANGHSYRAASAATVRMSAYLSRRMNSRVRRRRRQRGGVRDRPRRHGWHQARGWQAYSGTNTVDNGNFAPSLSADGSRFAYVSHDPGIVPGDTNAQPDLFVHDFVAGITQRVNTDIALQQAAAGVVAPAGLSADGRFVAFTTRADLKRPDTNGADIDIFVRGAMVPVIGSVAVIDPVTNEERLPRAVLGHAAVDHSREGVRTLGRRQPRRRCDRVRHGRHGDRDPRRGDRRADGSRRYAQCRRAEPRHGWRPGGRHAPDLRGVRDRRELT